MITFLKLSCSRDANFLFRTQVGIFSIAINTLTYHLTANRIVHGDVLRRLLLEYCPIQTPSCFCFVFHACKNEHWSYISLARTMKGRH